MPRTRLKDQTETEDVRLNRLRHFDERSRGFKAVTPELADRPRRGNTWNVGAVLDQGAEGACVGFAWAHLLLSRPAAAVAATPAVNAKFAREKIYWEAQKIDPWDGGSYPGASPVYEGTAVLAGAKILHDLGWFREFRWAFGENDLALTVGYRGPAVLGIDWHDGMSDPDEDGFIHPTGDIVGGHAIICCGYSLPLGAYLLQNSWGKDWGINGRCWVRKEDMAKLLKAGGEACVPVRRRRLPKVPRPRPA